VATLEKKNTSKKNKEPNQDNIIADPETGILGVLDGLGGEGHGDLASKSAERFLPENFKTAIKKNDRLAPAELQANIVEHQINRLTQRGITDFKKWNALDKKTTQMLEAAAERDPVILQKAWALVEALHMTNKNVTETGGFTTACTGLIHQASDGSRWVIATNIGDSGAFIRKKDGAIARLTEEDSLFDLKKSKLEKTTVTGQNGQPISLLQAMKDTPRLKFAIPGLAQKMSYVELKVMTLGVLGDEKHNEPSLVLRQIEPGDEIIFATDGIIDKFEDPKTDETDFFALELEAARGANLKERTTNLRQEAKQRKASYKKEDDATLVVARAK
jgi:serine/threonine protein phosphatase PrpC